MAGLRKEDFAAFYIEMLPRVCALLWKMKCPLEDQMDVAHTVFADMWRKVCEGIVIEKPQRYVLQAAKLRWWCALRDGEQMKRIVDRLNQKYGARLRKREEDVDE